VKDKNTFSDAADGGDKMSTEIPGFPEPDELQLTEDVSESDAPVTGPATFGERESCAPYRGPERRTHQRRQGEERRAEIRFEPGKDDRRTGRDRRKGGWKTNSTL
jgi:hypothetical protein